MKFPYAKSKTRTPEGREHHALLPLIPIGVRFQGRTIRYMALLDSGAETSMFHQELGAALDIDVERGAQRTFYGIGHGRTVGYVHTVELEVGGWWIDCPVAFCPGMIRMEPGDPPRTIGLSYGILGQEGFFDKFRVIFDRSAQQVELKPKFT